MILLSAQQRTWFLEQMTKIDSLPVQDCGQPEEVAQGNPYVSYGQYYTPQTEFRAFFDWASNGQSNCRQFEHIFYQLVASIFPLNATFQRLLQE
jgi:hypothetical protein